MLNKNKGLLSSLLLILPMAFSLTSCSPVNDDNLDLSMKTLDFHNTTDMYNVKDTTLDTYYETNSTLPYVSVTEFVDSLEGFINTKYMSDSFDTMRNKLTLSWRSSTYRYECVFNWNDNTIYVNNIDFFNLRYTASTTNFSKYLSMSKRTTANAHSVTYHLNDYNFDILFYKGQCLVPFHILNTLFCSYFEVQYNGDAYYATYDNLNTQSDEIFDEIKTSSLNGKKRSYETALDNYNHLLFALDYYYGLKDDKEITYFKDYISSDLKDRLLSTDINIYNDALLEFIYTDLNELHTRVDSFSFYNYKDDTYDKKSYYGEFWNKYYDSRALLMEDRKNKLGEDIPLVRYINNKAIITFDSFKTGLEDEIYNKDGSIRDDAYLYDTHELMKKCMNEIGNHDEVNKIIIDLSLNGGGNVGALYRALGYLTNNDIQVSSYNSLSGECLTTYYKVDVNEDGNYDENDAYTQYKWYVLSGINTFSAANQYVSIIKNQNIARIIGKTSGGGMCSILPIAMVDGTNLDISSNNTARYVKFDGDTYMYNSIEHGIDPDFDLDYQYFYDDAYLDTFIDSL